MSRHRPTTTSNNDDGTDDEDLGFDPKKPKAAATKLDFFDDILGSALSDPVRPATFATQPVARRREERRLAMSRQSTDTTTDNSNIQRPRTSTGYRSSVLSTTSMPDPLGLFTLQTNEQQQNITSNTSTSLAAPRKRPPTADWLGLNITTSEIEVGNQILTQHQEMHAESPPKTVHNKSDVVQQQNSNYEILKLNEQNERSENVDVTFTAQEISPPTSVAAQSMLQLNNMNQDTRNAFALLQQQESQLTITAQMKQQERTLFDMQRKQECLLQQQERQFQMLMRQQLQRHQNLEESLIRQQQRINAHIQLMLTQPVTALEAPKLSNEQQKTIVDTLKDENDTKYGETHATVTSQITTDAMQIGVEKRRLELEKLRLEELLANFKTNYEREIEMIDCTYRKQLTVLNEHTKNLETRLRAEISEISGHYKLKLKENEEELKRYKTERDSEKSVLKQDHEDELRRIRKSHEEDFEMLREEHHRMLESVQRSKLHEFAVVQDNSSYLQTLRKATTDLTDATTDIQALREELQTKLETNNREKQQTLEARELRIADKERRLELSTASAEEERTRLMKLVSTLEQQLNVLTKESADENWQLRLKLSALEGDKITFEREREYAREQMQRDEQRLEKLKEQKISEAQRIQLELQEERRQLQLEKTKFETELQLRSDKTNLGKELCDLEVAMKCAQDAARQADAERQRYFSLQCDLEQRKRELIDFEMALRSKQEKLKAELNACYAAEQQTKEAAQRIRLVEQSFNEKLQALQQRTCEIAEKEASIAEERKLLSQQRIVIKEVQNRIAQRQCDVCQQKMSDLSIGSRTNLNSNNKVSLLQKQFVERSPMFIVDRLLDENISESLQLLQVGAIASPALTASAPVVITTTTTNTSNLPFFDETNNRHKFVINKMESWLPPLGLDDDTKTLALNNFDSFQ